ncbi:hypothetical protein N8T08_007323 [Aspergillus melleus]|uniref:Uncharacterized protein n=1 Tax=Aspergillus melleus TaxID=138277 RepID=A0ACC3AYQ6_9EURO|nr:hypothetical protein N8T08_007323 [Aspergillus melleus]
MRTIFHLPWRLSGMTNQKVKTKLRASVLRKLGQRVYRVRYCFRSVFLRNVKLADKGGPADLVVNGDGDAAMQVDEDAGFLADVEDNEVDAHPIVTTTFVVGNHVNVTSMGITHQVDDVFSDNSTFLSPTSLLTNSPAATISTPATTTVASSFDGDDEDDDDDDEEAETALTAGTIIQTIEGEDLDDSEDLDLDFNLSTTHIHAHITNHNNNPSLNLPTTINDLDTENSDESITPPPPLHPTDTDWVPSDNEGTSVDLCCADSPIVIHEFKRTVVRDDGVQEKVPCGYVGFVGHVDDSRSMSTLILGMCAVPKFVEGV